MALAGTRPFESGEIVLHRMPFVDESGSQAPQICDVKPMVVVEDGPALISLFLPAHTPTKLAVPFTKGRPKPRLHGEGQPSDLIWFPRSRSWARLEDSVLKQWNALFLIVPGAWRAPWLRWTPEWDFLGWYVNLQEPIRRTPIGFDVRDLDLDILVDPERRWRWKDEDELEGSVEAGVISAAVADRTRAEGLAAVADIEAGAWPFTEEMSAWRPDPAWPQPTLPEVPLDELLHLYDEEHWSSPTGSEPR